MENKKGQPTTEAIFRGIQSGKVLELFDKLQYQIAIHGDLTYSDPWGEVHRFRDQFESAKHDSDSPTAIGRYPFADVWIQFYETEVKDYSLLLEMCLMASHSRTSVWRKGFGTLLDKLYGKIPLVEYEQALEHLEHPYALSEILWALEWDYRDQEVYLKFSHYILLHLLPLLTPRNITFLYSVREWFGSTSDHRVVLVHCYWIDCWLKHPKRLLTDDEFTADFKIRYELYRLCNFLSYKEEPYPLKFPIRAVDFGRACQMGLLSEDTLMVELMDRPLSPVLIEEAVDFFYKKDQKEKRLYTDCRDYDFSRFKKVLEKVTERILDIELERGEACTDVTSLARKLDGVTGAELMIRLLSLMGKEKFIRLDKWYYDTGESRTGMFCHLMLHCAPSPTDTPDWLKMLVERAGITPKRLVEMAVYSPRWLEMVEEAIGWKGLTCAANLFYAYTRECYDDVDEARITPYTLLSPLEISVGAVDTAWFWKAYNALGRERYEKVFAASKAVTESSGVYSRFRKYTDALVGKYTIAQLESLVMDNRNKDWVRAYPLAPFAGKARKKEVDARLRFLKAFWLSSDTLSGRHTAEKEAVQVALDNLTGNSGLGNLDTRWFKKKVW